MRNLLLPLAVCLLGGAVILPAQAAARPGEEITHLLDFVGKSPCSFIRNGVSHPATEAKAHLERKYARLKDRIKTADDFIDHVASRSSTSGEPYLVRCEPGETRQSAEWFRSELQRFRGRSR
ncbi:MAG: DUF5329 family protein [Candidatus Methylomirabilota bacterium]